MGKETVETITRQELFELVWQEPLSKLSKRLGINLHRIVKICEKYEIPHPSSGHWSLVSWGEVPARPGLLFWGYCHWTLQKGPLMGVFWELNP